MRWLSFAEMPWTADQGPQPTGGLNPELVAHLQPHLLASCRGLVGSMDAEDLAQEVWVAALERPPRETMPAAVLGYLRAIARNLAADHFRNHSSVVSALAVDVEGMAW